MNTKFYLEITKTGRIQSNLNNIKTVILDLLTLNIDGALSADVTTLARVFPSILKCCLGNHQLVCVGLHGDSDPVVRGDDLSVLEPGDLGIMLVEVTCQGQLVLLNLLVVQSLDEFCGLFCKNICQC